jgi:hypothetical protein
MRSLLAGADSQAGLVRAQVGEPIGEIQAALKEADAGDFASDKDVTALAKKWKVNAG